jgi:hypothetical protein
MDSEALYDAVDVLLRFHQIPLVDFRRKSLWQWQKLTPAEHFTNTSYMFSGSG